MRTVRRRGVELPLRVGTNWDVGTDGMGGKLVVPLDQAHANGVTCEFPARKITLNVNAALDAIGFLAVITMRLAAAGIGVNAVSTCHHDHIVPANRAEGAMRLLSTWLSDPVIGGTIQCDNRGHACREN